MCFAHKKESYVGVTVNDDFCHCWGYLEKTHGPRFVFGIERFPCGWLGYFYVQMDSVYNKQETDVNPT